MHGAWAYQETHSTQAQEQSLQQDLCSRGQTSTYRAKHKIASRNARRRPYDNRKEEHWYINRDCYHDRDHDRDRDRNRTYDNERQAAKRPCVERPGHHDRKDDCCDNQPKNLGYEKPKSNGKVPCPIHSFPDKPAKHL